MVVGIFNMHVIPFRGSCLRCGTVAHYRTLGVVHILFTVDPDVREKENMTADTDAPFFEPSVF